MKTDKRMKFSFAEYIEERFGVKPQILSKKEECELMRAWKEKGDKRALEKLMASHLFLVVRIAKSFSRFRHFFDELVQEGNIGLMEAIERFDIDRGTRLSSYAIFHVRRAMREFLCKQGFTIPFPNKAMPFQKQGQLFRLKKRKNIFFCIGDEMLEECARTLVMKKELLAQLDRYLSPDTFLSLHKKIQSSKRDTGVVETLQDRLCDEGPSPEDICMTNEQESICRTIVKKILSLLSEKEQTILIKRKMSDTPMKLSELGQEFGVSRERVRQIEVKAFQKLRRVLQNPELRKMADENYNNILSS